jgi:hypothetical protein
VRRSHWALTSSLGAVLAIAAIVATAGPGPVLAQGVGDASWTPARSMTTTSISRFLTPDDSIIYRTDAVWDRAQSEGLSRYLGQGLRYTHEVNDRKGRLGATGFWATNHPDPAFDRDDDDGDGRWEEAEIIAGNQRPEPDQTYTTMVQFSRWHGKRQKGECNWSWDRRLGTTEVLSQLSRDLLGEWQAERYTLTYDSEAYPRVGTRPDLPTELPPARCRDAKAGPGQNGFVVTFAGPIEWQAFLALPDAGSRKWTAFEAIGSSEVDDLVWTCGGPATQALGLRPCKSMGVEVDGVVAAVGYFDDEARAQLADHPDVAEVQGLRDSLTGLLFAFGGFGVERPGLTVNDRYWELFLSD